MAKKTSKNQKKQKMYLYIGLFTLLGWMVMYMIYALIEYFLFTALLADFNRWGLGLTWNTWWYLHFVAAAFFSLNGAILGFVQGKYWWKFVYEDELLARMKR